MTTLDDMIRVERRLPRAGELYLDLDNLNVGIPNTILCVEDHRLEDGRKLVLDFGGLVAWLADEIGALQRRIAELDALAEDFDGANYDADEMEEHHEALGGLAAFGSVLRLLKGGTA